MIYTDHSSGAGCPLPYQALSGRAFTLGIPSIRFNCAISLWAGSQVSDICMSSSEI